MAIVPKCQPRRKPAPYKRKPKEALQKSGPGPRPVSSAKPLEAKQGKNLTLYDWMTVFGYVDTHPDASQTDVVNFFQTRAEAPQSDSRQSPSSHSVSQIGGGDKRVHIEFTLDY
ncbi:hypothetical protein OG21DRAFT_1605567 [Imleria badia]|nr:hypothetical protein OG21DRAFT_1605567 [Imleria badia]